MSTPRFLKPHERRLSPCFVCGQIAAHPFRDPDSGADLCLADLHHFICAVTWLQVPDQAQPDQPGSARNHPRFPGSHA